MKKVLSLLLTLSLLLSCPPLAFTIHAQSVIKVACVGDSITEGMKSENATTDSYPAQLQLMLGSQYEVKNFGVRGMCAGKETNKPYWDNAFYQDSLDYQPDVVILMMGTNDASNSNKAVIDNYKADMTALVQSYLNLPSAPDVYLATSPKCDDNAVRAENVVNIIIPAQLEIAEELDLPVVDMYGATCEFFDLFPDKIHPNNTGYCLIAQRFYTDVFNGTLYDFTAKAYPGFTVSAYPGPSTSGVNAHQQYTVDNNGTVTFKLYEGQHTIALANNSSVTATKTVQVPATTHVNFVGIPEDGNVARFASVTASTYDAGLDPRQAIDGDDTSRWGRNSGHKYASPHWLKLDFGTVFAVDQLSVIWENLPESYSMEASVDGTDWVTLINNTAPVFEEYTLSNGDVRTKTDVTFPKAEARYVRINMTAQSFNNNYYLSAYEIAIHAVDKETSPVVAYPLKDGYTASSVATVTVNGKDVPVRDFTNIYDYAQFCFDGTAEIKVTVNETINTFSVSPLAKNIQATADGKTLSFTISQSQYMIVKINNLKEIVITADTIDADAPADSGEGIYNIVTDYGADATGSVMAQDAIQAAIDAANQAGGGIVYVPAGLYTIDSSIVLKSNIDLYLAANATIRSVETPDKYTTFFHKNSLDMDGTWLFYTEENTENIRIRGRGVIDANGYAMRTKHKYLATIVMPIGCSGFTLDGVTLLDGNFWSFIPSRCDNVTVTNTKHLNEKKELYENDAIDICECQNVVVQHVLAISEDDTYSTKTWKTTTDIVTNWYGVPEELTQVTFDDCFGWTDCSTFKVGDGNFQKQSYVTFKNSYSYSCKAALKLTHGHGTAATENITFENLDLEKFGGKTPGYEKWLDFYQNSDGMVKNVVVRNINVRKTGVSAATLKGRSEQYYYDGVTFDHIYINGSTEPARTLQQMEITDRNSYVKNITILPAPDLPEDGNVAKISTITASDSHSYHPAVNAIDGDETTRWGRNDGNKYASPHWLILDFGSEFTVNRLTTIWENLPETYNVEISLDGTTWETVVSTAAPVYTDYTLSDGTARWKTEVSFPATKARYVRVHMTAQSFNENYYLSIYELGVYATDSSTVPSDPGDLDLNGEVNALDLTRLARLISRVDITENDGILRAADVDGNGSIGATDLTKLSRYVGGIDSSL